MGLAGRKQKQRIPPDPRNLSWADDASRFGLSYLSKFGWDASKGLGSSGDGIKTHIKVQQKLDMMGIGAQHLRDPNGIAWKQNKEFEALLRKLNESAELGEGIDDEDAQRAGTGVRETLMSETFVRAQEGRIVGKLANESSMTTTKRKHEDGDDPDASENTRKKQKKDRKEKRQRLNPDDASRATSEPLPALSSSKSHSEPTPKPHPMAHRARIRAAKRIAGKSASAIAEILGIAPSTTVSTLTSIPTPTPPSLDAPSPQPCISLDNLTISAKSVADYFKEKLAARPSSSFSPAESSLSSGSATPCPGLELSSPGDDSELPRRGRGSEVPVVHLPSRMLVAGTTLAGCDSNVDGQDAVTEKQCQKTERKAEKRKRREAEATLNTPEDISNFVEGDTERVQTLSKKERRQKKRYEEKEQLFTPQFEDKDTTDPVFKRKSKRQRKDER